MFIWSGGNTIYQRFQRRIFCLLIEESNIKKQWFKKWITNVYSNSNLNPIQLHKDESLPHSFKKRQSSEIYISFIKLQ